jgi:hypothetical protein
MKRILPREVSIIGFGRTQSQSWHGPKESPEERETQRDSCGFVEIPVIGYMRVSSVGSDVEKRKGGKGELHRMFLR